MALPKGRKGRTTTERGGGGRRSEPPSHGEVEGVHFKCPFISFKKRGTAAPPEEGRGKNHHPKEAEGIAAIGGIGGEGEVHLSFWWWSLPSPPLGGGALPLSPFLWC